MPSSPTTRTPATSTRSEVSVLTCMIGSGSSLNASSTARPSAARAGRQRGGSARFQRSSSGSGVVLAAVPGFRKRHVVARFDLDPPLIVVVHGLSDDQTEGDSETFDREWFDLDPAEGYLSQLL